MKFQSGSETIAGHAADPYQAAFATADERLDLPALPMGVGKTAAAITRTTMGKSKNGKPGSKGRARK